MAPASTEVRKSGRKKGSAQKQADPGKESHISEVEIQIQSEMERSQKGNLTQGVASGPEEEGVGEDEEEMEDSVN